MDDGHVSDASVIYLYIWWHLGTRGNVTMRDLMIMPDWIPLVDGFGRHMIGGPLVVAGECDVIHRYLF